MKSPTTVSFAARSITELAAKARSIEFIQRDPATGRILTDEDGEPSLATKAAVGVGAVGALGAGAAYLRGRQVWNKTGAPESLRPGVLGTIKDGGSQLVQDGKAAYAASRPFLNSAATRVAAATSAGAGAVKSAAATAGDAVKTAAASTASKAASIGTTVADAAKKIVKKS